MKKWRVCGVGSVSVLGKRFGVVRSKVMIGGEAARHRGLAGGASTPDESDMAQGAFHFRRRKASRGHWRRIGPVHAACAQGL